MTPAQEIKQQARIQALKRKAELVTQTFEHGLKTGHSRAECTMRLLDLIETEWREELARHRGESGQ